MRASRTSARWASLGGDQCRVDAGGELVEPDLQLIDMLEHMFVVYGR